MAVSKTTLSGLQNHFGFIMEEVVGRVEIKLALEVLEYFDGDKCKAIQALGISHGRLNGILKRAGVYVDLRFSEKKKKFLTKLI